MRSSLGYYAPPGVESVWKFSGVLEGYVDLYGSTCSLFTVAHLASEAVNANARRPPVLTTMIPAEKYRE